LHMDGVGIWIAFKVALIMPLSGLYAYYLTRLMQRYRIHEADARIALLAAPISAPRPAEQIPAEALSGAASRSASAVETSERKANLG
jgi:hypothetical protein